MALIHGKVAFGESKESSAAAGGLSIRHGIACLVVLVAGWLVVAAGSADADANARARLDAALASTKGGETIVLPDGDYGALSISQVFNEPVTIRSETPHGARFGVVMITGANVVLDGIAVYDRFTLRNASGIEVRNSRLGSWAEAIGSQDIRFRGNEIKATLMMQKVLGFDVSNNFFYAEGGINGDHLTIVDETRSGTIANNTMADAAPVINADGTYTHSDAIQFYTTPSAGDWPSSILIRGNFIYDDPATGDAGVWMQGINVGGRDIIIEENLVMAGTPNAIIVANSPGGIEVRNNTVLPWPDGSGGNIRVNNTSQGVYVDGNVASWLFDQGTAVVGDNFKYETGPSDNYFRNVFDLKNDGMVWTDFIPKEGSPIDFGSRYGAQERLKELSER